MESFFHSLKCERLYGCAFATDAELRRALRTYIAFHNQRRLHSALSYPAPAAYGRSASNIGFVLYTKSYAPGTLNARWIYANKYSGPGIATGGPKEGFAGHYHVRYFYDSGV